jgi:hypothetical protein
MQFSDPTNNSGIVEKARWFVGANASSYPIDVLTSNVNAWYDKAVATIMSCDNVWQFDDSNYTDYPIAVAALVSGQQDYQLDVSHSNVRRVEVKYESSDWKKLTPWDETQTNQALGEFFEESGEPQYYDLVANSVFLYPAPNYSQAASIKVYFQRKASYFDKTDTTKEPGFGEMFHEYLVLGAAYDYALKFNSSNRDSLLAQAMRMESDMKQHYNRRPKDFTKRLTPKFKSAK